MERNVEKGRVPVLVAIVGAGAVAHHHARHLAGCAGVRLCAVVDANRAAAEAFAARWKLARTHETLKALLDAGGVDAVHITTPPDSHESLVREALERGVDVFVEKPVAFTAAEVADLYALAAARGARLVPDFSLFHTAGMEQAHDWIRRGAIGRVIAVACAYHTQIDRARLEEPRTPPWLFQLPAGVLHNFFTHPLYLTLQFTGDVRRVWVAPRTTGSLPQHLTDHLELIVEGERCVATVSVSCAVRPTQVTLVINGERGRITVDLESFQVALERNPSRFGSVLRLLRPSLRGLSAVRQTLGTAWSVLRRRLVPYAGLGGLLQRFYARSGGASPIDAGLVLAVARVEEEIIRAPGRWHLTFPHACPTVPAAPRPRWIAVTGGTGNLGRQVVALLRQRGYGVRLLVRWQTRAELPTGPDVEVVYGDARNVEDVRRLLSGTEALIHLAAGMQGSRAYVVESCVEGTRNLIQAAKELGLQRNIQVSSMAVFDYLGLKAGEALADSTPTETRPEERSAYAQGKTLAERLVTEAVGRGEPWMIVRPSQIFGSGDLAKQLGTQLGRRILFLGGAAKAMRLVHVADVSRAIVDLVEPDRFLNGLTLNLTHPDAMTAREIAILLRKHRGLKAWYLPAWAGRSLAATTRITYRFLGKGPRISARQAAYLFSECGATATGAARHGWKPSAPLAQQLEQCLQ